MLILETLVFMGLFLVSLSSKSSFGFLPRFVSLDCYDKKQAL